MMPDPEDTDVLRRAMRKDAEGRGTTNTEKKALADYASGKIGVDHFAKIATTPVKPPTREPAADPAKPKRISIEDVEGLAAALRRAGTGDATDADVATLIGLGATFEEFTICDSGTPASRWWPTWTSDPTPP